MAFRPMNKAAMAKKKKRARRAAEATRMRGPRIKPEDIDYKDVPMLQRMVTAQGKLFSRKRSGMDAAGQRVLTIALKRARHLALMPFVS